MSFSGKAILAINAGFLFLGSAFAAPPNPSGTWDLRWDDRSYGVAFYEGDDEANVGEEFVRPSDYHTQDFLDALASIEPASIAYIDGASTVTISGAGETGVRTLEVESLPSGGGWQATGTEPLAISVDADDGCLKVFSRFERIGVTEAGELVYHRELVEELDPTTCNSFLSSLAEDFDFEKSGAILAAAYDSGAIVPARLPKLEEVQEIVVYEGTRASG